MDVRCLSQRREIHYLPEEKPGEWIIHPISLDLGGHPTIEEKAVFRRSFSLPGLPAAAPLRISACEHFLLRINDRDIDPQGPPGGNWKRSAQTDVLAYLKPGENRISVTVFNANGPPALWLSLTAGDRSLATDDQWQVSPDGAMESAATPATAPPPPVKGNGLLEGERSMESLLACRWVLLLYAVLSCAMTALVTWFGKGLADRFFVRFPWQGMALAVVAALWLCLFWNNLLSLRSFLGFDSLAHVDYVDYIQKHGRFPWPTKGSRCTTRHCTTWCRQWC